MSKNLSPVKSIRKFCIRCSGNSPKGVRLCPVTECSLYPYRFGKNPNRKGIAPNKALLNQKPSVDSAKNTKEGV